MRKDRLDYSADLQALATLVAAPLATSEILERGLEALGRAIPYDVAAIFRLKGDTARVIAAAGRLALPQVRRHELHLQRFPTIRRVLESRRPLPLEQHHHQSEEGDPYDGVLDLPHGHACMLVPLFAGEHNLGLITLDRRISGPYGSEAVELAGAYGQIMSLTLHVAELALLLERHRHQIGEHNRLLMEESGAADEAAGWLEASADPKMVELVRYARQVAVSSLPVLVQGETGTGKKVIAHAIHAWSQRLGAPFVKLDCRSIPENLVESELFGTVRGASSAAERQRAGRFVTANGGTLLLDGIGYAPLAAQAKLLGVLEHGTFEPVGSDASVKVDVRVVASTHVDLEEAVKAGRFREDLYYRLAVFPLSVPPLRERPSDILNIANGFLRRVQLRTRRGPWTLGSAACEALIQGRWVGNVRGLINALERATLVQPVGLIEPHHLGLRSGAASARRSSAPPPPLSSWQQNERAYLTEILRRAQGKLYGPDGAAAIAQLKPTTLRSKLVKHGLR
jgi:transcriptional regulator with GAF, ATPase, and Fis domain